MSESQSSGFSGSSATYQTEPTRTHVFTVPPWTQAALTTPPMPGSSSFGLVYASIWSATP